MATDEVTNDSPPLEPGLPGRAGPVAGRYEVRARLGRGGAKEVYLAYDARLDREVALAVVVGGGSSASALARVAREAQVMGRLGDHPNIITVHDTGVDDGVPYLVLRAMRGGSLADLLERSRPSFGDTVRLGGEIASALAHAHAHGVVHRDVKPGNVWLAADGSAALGDFGIAHQAGLERLTAEGVVVGTALYLSPEQIRGEEIGAASDLYALGVTLYELTVGRPPFAAKQSAAVLLQHLTETPVPPSQHDPAVPAALEELILALLAKQVADRPPSAVAVGEALARIATDLSDRVDASETQDARAGESRSGASRDRARRPDARRMVSVLAVRTDVEDPEALHGVLAGCTAVIEQHGGTIERLLGDALIGLFGVMESLEDDALRAARAAVELQATTEGLRFGIDSGEVFLAAGPRGTTIATGAAITAAGKLAEGAGRGEIRLGARIQTAVAAQASIDAATGRLLRLAVDRPALQRASTTPFLGRARELEELSSTFARARDERRCSLVTVLGAPGIGKSRLVGEFVAALGDGATVLAGRCLAYGEGTTFRALADIARGLGENPRARIEELLADDEQALRGVLGAVGLSDAPARAEETAWALRSLLERIARDRPLVVAIEDIHWAEPALLDLLENVVALSTGSPILLVCLTRPELLETRPGWAARRPRCSVLMLDALTDSHARELVRLLGAGHRAERITRRAEGNPLFVEQLVAVDAGADELPASIQAVLAARIDRLDPGERMLLQRAAVEGRTFHAGAVETLLPDQERARVGMRLVALARKGLVGADHSEFAGEEALRFTHALIREAAYAGIPKSLRIELHAGVAEWLAAHAAAADEIVGYHLEQAVRFASELGKGGPRDTTLAERAADRFEAASRVARARGDPAAAIALLERAVALIDSDDVIRGRLLPPLGASLSEAGRLSEAAVLLDEAIARAPEARLKAIARVEREFVRLRTETGVGTEEHARRVADAALLVLQRERDDRGQSRAWCLRASVAWQEGSVGDAEEAWRRAADYARRLGDERELFDIVIRRAAAAVYGPTPVDEAIRQCEELRKLVRRGPVAEASTLRALAWLYAMRGDIERARRLLREARTTRTKICNDAGDVSHYEAFVEMLAGEPARAEARLRRDFETLGRIGDRAMLATTAAVLAQAVYARGGRQEAERLCRLAEVTAAADDIATQVIWRGVRAKLLADLGSSSEALRVAFEAVRLAASTDLLTDHADALTDLAHVLDAAGSRAEAQKALQAAGELYARKGNVPGVAKTAARLDARRDGPSDS